MTIVVNGPGGEQFNFPDGTSPDVIKAAMQRHYAEQSRKETERLDRQDRALSTAETIAAAATGPLGLAARVGANILQNRARTGQTQADAAKDEGVLDRTGSLLETGTQSAIGGLSRVVGTVTGADVVQRRARQAEAAAKSDIAGTTKWDDVNGVGSALKFGLETGVQSLPEMAITAIPGFGLGLETLIQTGRIGQQRAENDGRADASGGDLLAAAPFALGSTYLEKLGIKAVGGSLGGKLAGSATGRVATGIAGEAGTEALQSGIEYAGGTVGTEKGFDVREAGSQMLAGGVAGGIMGGAMSGTVETGRQVVRRVSNRPLTPGTIEAATTQAAELTEADRASPLPDDLISEGRSLIAGSEASAGADAILQSAGLPATKTRVTVTDWDGKVRSGVIEDAFTAEGSAGVSIRLDDGSLLKDFTDDIRDAGVTITPMTADEIAADLKSRADQAEAESDAMLASAEVPAPEVARPVQQEPAPVAEQAQEPASADLDGTIKGYMARTRKAESGGSDTAKNPSSSASGRYQFTDGTWLATYRAVYGKTGESDAQILAKKVDGQVQDILMERLTRDNARGLAQAGIPIDDTSLYVAHFAGIAGARKLYGADRNAPVEQVLGADVVKANGFLRGMTAGQAIAELGRRHSGGKAPVDVPDTPEVQVAAAETERPVDPYTQALNDELQRDTSPVVTPEATAPVLSSPAGAVDTGGAPQEAGGAPAEPSGPFEASPVAKETVAPAPEIKTDKLRVIAANLSDDQVSAVNAALPNGIALSARPDGSFTAPKRYEAIVRAAIEQPTAPQAPLTPPRETVADQGVTPAPAAAPAPAPAEAAAGSLSPTEPIATVPQSVETRDVAITTAGREVPVDYAVVDLKSLTTSHNEDGAVNPAFPAALQPRDRARGTSQAQIAEIAARLDPRLLGKSIKASDGAPIISPAGVVESGNGRTLALGRAYRMGGEKIAAYQQFIRDQGFSTDGVDQPVLVRIRRGDMAPTDVEAFTREANQRDTAGFSATEQAASDAAALPASLLDLYRGGDVDMAGNRDFVRRFMAAVVPTTEQAGMIAADGSMSQEAVRRITSALVQRAYGNANLVAKLAESTDSNIKAIGGALADVSGAWAKMVEAAKDGRIEPKMDITGAVNEAVGIVERARREGKAITDLVGQADIFSGEAVGPVTEGVLRLMLRGKNFTSPVGRDKLAQRLNWYVDQAMLSSADAGLFGPAEKTTPGEIIGRAQEKFGEQQAGQGALFGQAERTDAGDGGGVRESSGAGDGGGAPVPERSGDESGAQGEPRLSQPDGPFGPIFDDVDPADWPAVVARLREAGTGEVLGALQHPEIGAIDVPWGDARAGLAKIMERHPEVVGDLPRIIERLPIIARPEDVGNNRYVLQDEQYRAVISPDYYGETKHWIVTAFELESPPNQTSRRGSVDASDGGSTNAGDISDIKDFRAPDNSDAAPEIDRDTLATIASLTDRLSKLNLSDKVRLAVKDVINGDPRIAGSYHRKLITVAMNSAQLPEMTVDHEIVHAVKELGLFRPAEWNALTAAAAKDAKLIASIERRYPMLDRQGQLEEAVADRFMQWANGVRETGFVQAAFARVREFFEALGGLLTGRGFANADAVMRALDRGEMGSRGGNASASEPKLSIYDRTDAPFERTATEGPGGYSGGPVRDLLGSTSGGSIQAVFTKMDAVREGLQDKMLSVLRTQQAVGAGLRKGLPENENAYLAEELYSGKTGRLLEQLYDERVEPLMQAMHEEGVDLDELETYLYARHAAERNAQIAKINPEFGPGEGSGMTDTQARAILNRIAKAGKEPTLKALASYVDTINSEALQARVDSGLLSEEEAMQWRQAYKHYVPLRGKAEVEGDVSAAKKLTDRARSQSGMSVKGKEGKRAFGRRSEADSILSYVILQAEEAIIRSEKNEAAKAFLRLAEAHPDPEFWEVDKIERRPVMDGTSGLVRYENQTRITAEDAPYTVSAKVDGIEHRITMNRDNPMAVRVAAAMRNLDGPQFGTVMSFAAKFGQVFSAINTRFNPSFVVRNAMRDAQTMAFISQTYESEMPGFTAQVARDYFKAMGAKRNDGSEWAKWRREWEFAGGKVYFNDTRDLAQIKKELARRAKRKANPKSAAAIWTKTFDYLEAANEAVERAIRLSVYKNARQAGKSKAEAASMARNVTVNFSRKGKWSSHINAFFPFFNASVQGSTNLIRVMSNRRVRYAAAGFIVAGFLADLLNSMLSGDDDDGQSFWDKIPAHEKSKNIILMLPNGSDGEAVKIPLGWGLNALFGMGRNASAVARGAMKPGAASIGSALEFYDAFNPMGGGGHWLNTLMPTFVDPFIETLVTNRDFAGKPIQPDQSPYETPRPGSENYSDRAGWAKPVAKALNAATGGDAVVPGAVSISPHVIEHFADFATGGAGRFVGDMISLVADRFDPEAEPLTVRGVPIAKDLATIKSPWVDRTLFWDRVKDVREFRDRAEMYEKRGDVDGLQAYVDANRSLAEIAGFTKQAEKVMAKHRQIRGKASFAHEMGNLDDDAYAQAVKATREQEDAVVQAYNTRWNEVAEQAY